LDYARGVEVPANFAEHVAAVGIERSDSEGVRIGVGVPAGESQFFSGSHAKELVAANHPLEIVEACHFDFPDSWQ